MPIDDKTNSTTTAPPLPMATKFDTKQATAQHKRSPRSFRLMGVFEFEYDINPDIILKRPERTVIIEQQILMQKNCRLTPINVENGKKSFIVFSLSKISEDDDIVMTT